MQEPQWQQALAQHGRAVREFVAAAAAIPPARWTTSAGVEKWSPASVTQHLQLVYDGAVGELNGGSGIRIRTNWFMQRLLRVVFLRRILRTGRFPERAAAPRELRPELVGPGQQSALASLQASAKEFEALLNTRRTAGGAGLTHHLFGRLSPLDGLNLVTTHLKHHHKQLAG